MPSVKLSNYAYVSNEPVLAVDPSGEIVEQLLCAAARWFISCHSCSRRAANEGWVEAEKYLAKKNIQLDDSGGEGRNEKNAVGHCVRACQTMRDCKGVFDCVGATGVRTYLNTVYEAPLPEFLVPDRAEECSMDKHNNNIGMSCAAAKSKSCIECCMEHHKELVILDPPKPKR